MQKDNGESGIAAPMAVGVRGSEGDLWSGQALGPPLARPSDPPGGARDHSVPPGPAFGQELPAEQPQHSDIGFSVTLQARQVEQIIDRAIKAAAYAQAVSRGIAPPCDETEFRFRAKVIRYRDGRAAVTMEV